MSYFSEPSRGQHFPARALAWLIPSVLIASQEVVIVSPWLEDVSLEMPPSLGRTLGDLLAHLEKEGARLSLWLRERRAQEEEVLRRLMKAKVWHVEHLHAKGIFTESLALWGSFNLLETSVHRNVETVRLEWHDNGSAEAAAKAYIKDLRV